MNDLEMETEVAEEANKYKILQIHGITNQIIKVEEEVEDKIIDKTISITTKMDIQSKEAAGDVEEIFVEL